METSRGMLSDVEMVMQWCDGPRRPRDCADVDDDDDDVGCYRTTF